MLSVDSTAVAILAVCLVTLCACAGDEPASDMPGMEMPPSGSSAPAPSPTEAMMQDMTAHVQRVQGMRADSLQVVVPVHRQMVGNMLAQMNADMRAMNMATDAAWNALVDSLRANVVAMPDLSSSELESSMPAHLERVRRILDSHAAMMRGMRM